MDKAREQHNVLMDKGREQLTALGVSCYMRHAFYDFFTDFAEPVVEGVVFDVLLAAIFPGLESALLLS